MENEKVSIIIPFYNGVKYLENCINNISMQTYSNIEVIFINDGSTDNSIEEYKKFQKKNMNLINIDKSGVSVARNIGIEKATGKYIAFMDIDDWIENNYIEKFVNAIEENNCDIVLCNYIEEYYDKKVKIKLPWSNELIEKEQIRNELIPLTICEDENHYTINGLVWRTFTTKDFIISNNCQFDRRVSIAEDMLFVLKLYNCALKIYILEDYLYHYNRNNNSALNSYMVEGIDKSLKFHKIFVEMLWLENLYDIDMYNKNKLRMYTSLISNATRNPNSKSGKEEIKRLSKLFKKENIKYKKYQLDWKIKLSCFLLKNNFYSILFYLYKIKEKKRIRNFFTK